jgi:hypothetical protein
MYHVTPMPSRRSIRLLVLLLGCWILVFFADSTTDRALIDVDGVWDALLLSNYGPFDPRRMHPMEPAGFRVGDQRSEMNIEGFAPNAPITIEIRAASAIRRAIVSVVEINGVRTSYHAMGGRAGKLTTHARSDARGAVCLRMIPESFGFDPRGQPPRYRLLSVSVSQTRRGWPPWRRLMLYAAVVALPIAMLGFPVGGRFWAIPAAGVALSLAIVFAKPHAVKCLAAIVAGGVAFVFLKHLMVFAAKSERIAMLCAAATVIRVLAALHPAFPSIDATLHSHRLDTFRAGALVRNRASISEEAPKPVWLPYPPLAYAVLAPIVRNDEDVALVRVATAVIEASTPFLLLLICRAAGGSAQAAGLVAAAACVMPEGMLVVAKGILANAAGMWTLLAALATVLARLNPIIVAGAWILAYLGHVGSAAGLSALALIWIIIEWRRSRSRVESRARTILLAMAAGILGAYLLYYREVWQSGVQGLSLLSRDATQRLDSVFFVRWIYIGKILQNLVVKYGLLLPFVWSAFRSGIIPAATRRLLISWFISGSFLGILAVTSPFAFRFEYFLAGAVALAAGHGLSHWKQNGHVRLVWIVLLGTMLIQLLVAIVLLQAWWDPINVIIPSPRWWLASR